MLRGPSTSVTIDPEAIAAAIAAPSSSDIATAVAAAARPALLRAYGVLGFGETQSWLVMPTGGRQIKVYSIDIVQAGAGVVTPYEGAVLDDEANVPLDAAFPLGAGAPFQFNDLFSPRWSTATGNGLLLARANTTTTIAYSVRYTST